MKKFQHDRRCSSLLSAASAMLMAAAAGHAAAADQAPAEASSSASATSSTSQPTAGLSEVIVTASKRNQNLQDVPTTITAISNDTLKAYNIEGVLQLPLLVPGITVAPQAGNSIAIRGIGAGGIGYAESQSAVYLDGVYLTVPAMNPTNFNDIQQAEVLKGPQGTLYGRNAVSGLVSLTTLNPSQTPRVDASVGYANYDTFTAKLFAATPVTDNLGVSVSAYDENQGQGWTLNTFTGDRIQTTDSYGVHGKMVWTPSPDTKVTANLFYSYLNSNVGFAYQVYPGSVGTDGSVFLGQYKNNMRVNPSAPETIWLSSIKIEHDLSFAKLSSITAFQSSAANINTTFSNPTIGQPIAGEDVSFLDDIANNKTLTQELQLTSSNNSKLQWVTGLYYFGDNTRTDVRTWDLCINNVCGPGVIPTDANGDVVTTSYSAYGDTTYSILPSTRLTLGLRYTNESKQLSGLISPLPGFADSVATLPSTTVAYPGQPFAGFPNGIPTTLSFSQFTYRAVLAQDITNNVHAYVSYSTGFKSGAFQPTSFTNPPASPEHLYDTEAGVKSELLDHKLRLNAAYFHYDYENVQVSSTAPPALAGAPILENAAKETMDGVDVDYTFAPIKQLIFNGGAEFLRARYANFPGAQCLTPGTKVVNGIVVGNPASVICNLAGNTVPNAPPVSANLGVSYTFSAFGSSVSLNANDQYVQRYPLEFTDTLYQNSYNMVGASMMIRPDNSHFDLRLWGSNLGAAYVYAFGQFNRNELVVPQAPRTFGVTLGYHY